MKTFITVLSGVIAIAVMIGILSLLLAFPVMWLWNWLLPELFGFPEIGWTQALGLFVLTNMLFAGSSSSRSK